MTAWYLDGIPVDGTTDRQQAVSGCLRYSLQSSQLSIHSPPLTQAWYVPIFKGTRGSHQHEDVTDGGARVARRCGLAPRGFPGLSSESFNFHQHHLDKSREARMSLLGIARRHSQSKKTYTPNKPGK